MTARAIILTASVSALTLLATRFLFALLAIVFLSAFLFAFGMIALTGDLMHRKDKKNGPYRQYELGRR